nr:hypothetical protein [Photorhabdus temperata]
MERLPFYHQSQINLRKEDQRNTPVVRATSYLLIYLTAVYPLHPAMAAGINHNWPGNLTPTLT